MSTRRTLLRRLALVGGVATAGCTWSAGDDPETRESETTAGTPPPSEVPPASETPPKTDRPTDRPTRPTTKTCDEQYVFPDLRLMNERSSTATVTVQVAAESSGSDPLFFHEYVLAAGEEQVERERIYRDATPDSEAYRLTATVDGATESLDVTTAARNPSLYETRIEVHAEAPRLIPGHGDPGEDFNPNCYDGG